MNTIISTLEQQGFRITKARRAIAEIFLKDSHPLAAQEILKRLKNSVNKTTVYRELDFLVAQGLIKEVFLPDQIKRFERAEQKHHHHIVCVQCSSVKDVVVSQNLCSQAKRVARKSGYRNVEHSLEFFGVCPSCTS